MAGPSADAHPAASATGAARLPSRLGAAALRAHLWRAKAPTACAPVRPGSAGRGRPAPQVLLVGGEGEGGGEGKEGEGGELMRSPGAHRQPYDEASPPPFPLASIPPNTAPILPCAPAPT